MIQSVKNLLFKVIVLSSHVVSTDINGAIPKDITTETPEDTI